MPEPEKVMNKTKAGPVNAGRLKSFVERIEKLEEERHAIGSDIKDVYSEAKGVGYDVKTLRWTVSERKIDSADRDERDALRDTYAHALGMAVDLVRDEGLSLREAGRQTGVSKSSIQRALAVPEVSQTNGAPSEMGDRMPSPVAWALVTTSRDEHEAAWKAEADAKEAERLAAIERKRAEREEERERNRRIDADPLDIPAFLKRQPEAMA
jgi:uncharacterized protein (UPF0335 family)